MKIALLGYGKMGRAIEELALQEGHEVVLRVSSREPVSRDKLSEAQPDVAIEFSRPEKAFEHIALCLDLGLPVVCGTTGWLDRKAEAESLCNEKGGAFFYAPNFSIGVYLFFALNRYLASLMQGFPEYDPVVEEVHHLKKLDAPSGTAIRLAEDLLEFLPHKNSWTKGLASSKGELSVVSIRKGEVPGTHKLSYCSEEDEIVLQHKAFSRKGFARGALRAAEWLQGRKGCFEMKDMLQF